MSTKIDRNITVDKVMLKTDSFPVVREDTIIKDALEKMLSYNLGIVCVINDKREFIGLVTDGDIRRILLKVQKPLSALFMEDIMDHVSENPTTITTSISVSDATKLIGEKKVWDLPVVSNNKILLGLFHLHKALEYVLKENI